MAMGIFSLFFLLIPLLLLVLILTSFVGLIWLWIRATRQPSLGLPTCGQCGYTVHGVSTLSCPECGGDFRTVGIDTARQRGTVRPLTFVGLWTILLPLPALVAASLMIAFGPQHEYEHYSLTLTPTSTAPQQPAVASIEVSTNADMFQLVPPRDQLSVTLDAQNSYRFMIVDVATGTFADRMGTLATLPVDRPSLEQWFATASLNTSDPDVAALVDDTLLAIQHAASDRTGPVPTFAAATHSEWSFTNDFPALWWMILVGVFWLAVWVLGIALFFRIRRRQTRRLEEARAGLPAPPPVSAPLAAVQPHAAPTPADMAPPPAASAPRTGAETVS